MSEWLDGLVLCGVAYGLGCVSAGYYLVRWRRGVDVRAQGSGVTGALNVGRVLGGWGFGVVLLWDTLKGSVAAGLAQVAGLDALGQLLVLLAVIAGHNFPVQLGFKGGNGLATAAGGLLVWDWRLGAALAVCFGVALGVTIVLQWLTTLPVRFYTPLKLTVLSVPLVAFGLYRDVGVMLLLALGVSMIMFTVRVSIGRSAAVGGETGGG